MTPAKASSVRIAFTARRKSPTSPLKATTFGVTISSKNWAGVMAALVPHHAPDLRADQAGREALGVPAHHRQDAADLRQESQQHQPQHDREGHGLDGPSAERGGALEPRPRPRSGRRKAGP